MLENILNVLNEGKVSPLCDTCCPCGNFYYFGGGDRFFVLLEALQWIQYSEACDDPNGWFTECCTENCFNELVEYLGPESETELLEIGIFEYSSLGSKSTLCSLYEYIVQNNIPKADALDFVKEILNTGIVFACDLEKDVQIIVSVEEFLNYSSSGYFSFICTGEQQDPCQCYPQGCCLTVNSNLLKYLQFQEFLNPPLPPL
jgi:hypothetical protein